MIAKGKDLKDNKNLSLTEKSRATIYKVLKEELGYLSNRLVKATKGKEETDESK